MNAVLNLVFDSSLASLCDVNSSFDSGILQVAYTNQNRNGSFISKETFERCIKTIYNCPIVCNYNRETDSIGSHDMELVRNDNGDMYIANITTPVGMVPESAKYFWKNVEEDDGSVHEYLCVEVLLWKRQEAYRKIKRDGITSESMEISIKDGKTVDGVYIINDFEFTAFCLLGSAEPCYESASLEVFSINGFKEQLAEMMQEFKETFTLVAPAKAVDDIHPQNYSEGGEKALEDKKALMAQYGLTEDMLDFQLNDFSEDELREKFEAIVENQKKEKFALAEQFKEELIEALSVEKVETCFGEMSRYWYTDYDAEAMEVYCYDYEDWKLYGFSYSMNGDKVSIDFGCKTRKKYSIVDFDEGEQPSVFAAIYSKVAEQYSANDKQWAEKYQTASEEVASMNEEVNTLRKFKADTEAAIAKGERDEVFAKFEDLVGIDAFEALKEDCMKYDADSIEEKCYAIRGRNGTQAKFNYEPKAPKLKIEKTDNSTEPYGGLFTKYKVD